MEDWIFCVSFLLIGYAPTKSIFFKRARYSSHFVFSSLSLSSKLYLYPLILCDLPKQRPPSVPVTMLSTVLFSVWFFLYYLHYPTQVTITS